MPRFLRIRSRLGALFEPQRVLVSITLKASFAKKAGGSAICKKREKNSLAALPIVYLFFIIYSKSTVGQLQIEILFTLCSCCCRCCCSFIFELNFFPQILIYRLLVIPLLVCIFCPLLVDFLVCCLLFFLKQCGFV